MYTFKVLCAKPEKEDTVQQNEPKVYLTKIKLPRFKNKVYIEILNYN